MWRIVRGKGEEKEHGAFSLQQIDLPRACLQRLQCQQVRKVCWLRGACDTLSLAPS